jgi:uncharacterized protein YdaL
MNWYTPSQPYDARPSPTPAPITALTVSGLPTDSFLYLGYLPHKTSERHKRLEEVESQPYTLVFLESPYRIVEALEDIFSILGDRKICVAREMTKMFEEYWRGNVEGAVAYFKSQPPRGEFTLVVEGKTDITSYAIGDGRHLAMLLGHFHTRTTVLGVDEYAPGGISRFDHVFYIGFHAHNVVPGKFLNDLLTASVPVVWIHTGFAEFSASHDVAKRYGFAVSHIDSTGGFHLIEHGGDRFTKEEPNLNVVTIVNRAQVEVLATAYAEKTRRRVPYIVRSGNLLYVADSPFASTSPADRYILFADLLHDILGEDHERSHSAIIRIEDVNPMEDPDRLRDVADVLSERDIPFLVGVSPFYVDPGGGLRVSLSDKPEVVDALKYMVRNGGTIVMHGTTHQYKGVTGADFEFWDESTNRPIKGETEEAIGRKVEMGIQEFMQNGLYPLLWETPHYTGSFRLYRVIGDYFSTAMEQRLAIEDADYSQFFPYIIHRDLFGQTIYPENLGYVRCIP